VASLPERPEVVFFDVGDTLLRPHPSWVDVYASVFPQFGIEIEQQAFATAFREAFLSWEFEGPFEASAEASFQRFKDLDSRIFERLGYPELPDEFFRAIDRAFAARSSWYVFDDVIPSLGALRAAGVRMGVISNWGWSAPELLHDLELAAHFEALTISARVGYQKPHANIYRHALESMRVAPEAAIHVGDSYRADVEGARAAGIAAVLIDRRAGASPHSERPQPDDVPLVCDLYELLDLLEVGRPAVARVN
jgi:putative hydrolase of the HAD superfamily